MNRHTKYSLVLIIALATVAIAAPRSIFDDDWTPPKDPTTPRTVPAAKPIIPPVDPSQSIPTTPPKPNTRQTIPSSTEQSATCKVLKDVYAAQLADHTPAARNKLAESLIARAAKSANIPVEQFVLLAAAVDSAVDAANLPLAFTAADLLAKSFDVDALGIKAEAVLALNPKAAASELTSTPENIRVVLELAGQLAEASDIPTAIRICVAIQPLASTVPDLRAMVQKRMRELAGARDNEERLARSREKLKIVPNDPTANLALGRQTCFVEGNWPEGLPMLAKGSDATLKAPASLELNTPPTAPLDSIMQMADAWWELAAKQSDAGIRGAIIIHAGAIYQPIVAKTTGLRRTQIENRIADAVKAANRITTGPGSLSDAEGLLEDAQFLDWNGQTWHNDIRKKFTQTRDWNGIHFEIKSEGYDHKLIVFDKIDPRLHKLKFRITLESGDLNIGLRPRDLSPHGLQLQTKLKAGQVVEVRIGFKGEKPTAEVDGHEIPLVGEGENVACIALMPSRSCRFVIHQITATDR